MTTFLCPKRGKVELNHSTINDDDLYIYDIFGDCIVRNLGSGYYKYDHVSVMPGQTPMKGLSLKSFLWRYNKIPDIKVTE